MTEPIDRRTAEAIAATLRSAALTIREQYLAPIQAAEYLNQYAATVIAQSVPGGSGTEPAEPSQNPAGRSNP